MWCSTRSTVRSSRWRMSMINSPRPLSSSWLRPQAGSSRSNSDGSHANARASSTRFCDPKGKSATVRSARDCKRITSIALSARSVAARSERLDEGRRKASARKPAWWCACAPIMTFSLTVIVRNRARFWNVRPTPSAAMRCRGCSDKRCPSKWMDPVSQRYSRERQLNKVLLPAPLGPMRPRISPLRTSKLMPSSATMPPKRTDTFSRASSALSPLF